MNLSVAFVKNENQVLYRQFIEGTESSQIFDMDELKQKPLHGLFVPSDLMDAASVIERVESEAPYSPVRPVQEDFLNEQAFEKLNHAQTHGLLEKTFSTWTLQNNLHLLENLFETLDHLKALWPNDRTAFFEEVWNLLKVNLGTTSMTLAYNHMRKAKKEHEKNQLIRVVIEGERSPNPTENKELGLALFKNYEGQFTESFEVKSYDATKGELVALGSINTSPFIIMAKVFTLTTLQKALLKSLFDGLQDLKK
jgi:hypothetical protein